MAVIVIGLIFPVLLLALLLALSAYEDRILPARRRGWKDTDHQAP